MNVSKSAYLNGESPLPLINFNKLELSIVKSNFIGSQDKEIIISSILKIWNINATLSGQKYQDFLVGLQDFNDYYNDIVKTSDKYIVSDILLGLDIFIRTYGEDNSRSYQDAYEQRVVDIIR